MLNITPKPAQQVALNMLRQHWKQYRTFLLSAPVGYGKTAVAAFIIDGFIKHNMRVMFAAPYTVLVTQTAERFIQYGLPEDEIGYVWRDHPNYDPDKLIQIASTDTLIRREFPDNIDLLIIDEAHMRRKWLLELIRDSKIKVIGLSGSPFAKFMGQYYEKFIKPTTMRDLIKAGDLSDYEFYAPIKPDLSGVKSQSTAMGPDYKEEELAKIMCGADLVGNIVDNWLANGENLPTICFCVNVAHANYVVIQFNKAGVAAEIMTASTPHDDRQLIIKRFELGITKVLVNVGVLVAGFDSDVRCVIYARPTKSEIRWIQSLGRGLRSAPGKKHCKIFDHSGTVHRLGYPDNIEYDSLLSDDDGMKETKQAKKEKEEKLPKECPECHFMKPAGVYVCPKCGFKPLHGENVETDESRSLTKLKNKELKDKHTKELKQYWWSQIKFYQSMRAAQGRPVSDGWCSYLFKDKFNEWPSKSFHNSPSEITPEVSNFIRHKNIAFAKGREKAQKQVQEQLSLIREKIAERNV